MLGPMASVALAAEEEEEMVDIHQQEGVEEWEGLSLHRVEEEEGAGDTSTQKENYQSTLQSLEINPDPPTA